MQHGGQEVDEEKAHHCAIDVDDICDAHIQNAHEEANAHCKDDIDDLRDTHFASMRLLHTDHCKDTLLADQHKFWKD